MVYGFFYKGGEIMRKKNEPSKWEIELISLLAIGFVFETVRELMNMLDLEDVKKNKKKLKEVRVR